MCHKKKRDPPIFLQCKKNCAYSLVWDSLSTQLQRSCSWLKLRFRANSKSVVMCWPVDVTQVYRAQKLDEFSYPKTLSVWGVSVSITKSERFKSVNWQLKVGAISGRGSNCDQSTVAFRLLNAELLDTPLRPAHSQKVNAASHLPAQV